VPATIARRGCSDHDDEGQDTEAMTTSFADGATQPRIDPAPLGGERDTLAGFLQWQRDTLRIKCAGLDAEQLARRAVPPSGLSLIGLVRHLAGVERSWFRELMAGQEPAPLFGTGAEPDADFTEADADPQVVAEALAAWREEMAFTDRFVTEAPDLDLSSAVAHSSLGVVSLRWVLLHLVEEYARHLGHADLLRERIDGSVGE
jgi:uncharacterized damage-inducible protein DinB